MAVKICSGSYLGQKVILTGNGEFISTVLVQEKHFEVLDAFRSLLCTEIRRHYVTYVDVNAFR